MATHYEKQFVVFQRIDSIIRQRVFEDGQEVEVNDIVYELSSKFPISPSAIVKRIDSAVQFYKHKGLRLVDEKLFSVGGKDDHN